MAKRAFAATQRSVFPSAIGRRSLSVFFRRAAKTNGWRHLAGALHPGSQKDVENVLERRRPARRRGPSERLATVNEGFARAV